jgi:hypothetical protein
MEVLAAWCGIFSKLPSINLVFTFLFLVENLGYGSLDSSVLKRPDGTFPLTFDPMLNLISLTHR